ncbi:Receptor kinase-like protein Xa21, partial [Camellia lanceoleosa]
MGGSSSSAGIEHNPNANNFSGTIPKQLFSISSLSISLNLGQNSLFGSLPSEVGKLKNLAELDISENKLSGE